MRQGIFGYMDRAEIERHFEAYLRTRELNGMHKRKDPAME
jgi:hypothetical protein